MFILLLLIWIVLNGRVTAEILVFGCLISGGVTLLSRRAFGFSRRMERRLFRNVPLLIYFTGVLTVEIVKAAFLVMGVVLNPSKKPDPVLVEFHSGLPTDLQNVLLANSITLTPGTFTVVQDGDRFVVHCLRAEYADGIEDSVFVRLLARLDA